VGAIPGVVGVEKRDSHMDVSAHLSSDRGGLAQTTVLFAQMGGLERRAKCPPRSGCKEGTLDDFPRGSRKQGKLLELREASLTASEE
jgi:hypothetical protein